MREIFSILVVSLLSAVGAARAQMSAAGDDTVPPHDTAVAAEAQDTVVVVGAEEYRRMASMRDMDDVRAMRREYWRERVDMHDIRLGIGSINLSTGLMLTDEWFGSCCDDVYYPDSFRDQMLLTRTYLTPERLWGTFSLSYTYHGRRRVEAGVMATFAASTQRRKDIATDRTVESYNRYAASVLPMVRLLWLHRRNVSLYSSVGLGIVLTVDEGQTRVLPWYDLSLIGCTFGRRLFGFAELGAGMSGTLRVGIGYRFNASAGKGGIK